MKNLEGHTKPKRREISLAPTTALRNIVTAWTLWRTNWHSLPIKWTRTIKRIKRGGGPLNVRSKESKEKDLKSLALIMPMFMHQWKKKLFPYSCKYPNIATTLRKDRQLGDFKLKSSFMFSSSEPAGTLLMKQNWHKNWTTKSPQH